MSNIFSTIKNYNWTFGHLELLVVILIAGAGALWQVSGSLSNIQTTQTYQSNHLESVAKQQQLTNKQIHELSVQTGILILRVDQMENDLVKIKYRKADGTIAMLTTDLDSLLESGIRQF